MRNRNREAAGQLRLLPTVVEIKRQKAEAHARAQLSGIRCWQCKQVYSPDLVNPHPESKYDVCTRCWDDHPAFYERWLSRRLTEMESQL